MNNVYEHITKDIENSISNANLSHEETLIVLKDLQVYLDNAIETLSLIEEDE